METKKCNECRRELNIRLFWKRKDTPDGYFSKCINCCKTRKKAIRSRWKSGQSYADKILSDLQTYDEKKGVFE